MNGALLQEGEVAQAMERLDESRLERHPTTWKNWDLWDFISVISKSPRDSKILDVGCASSPLLFNLAKIGFEDLTGIDFDFPPGSTYPHPHVKYERGDLRRTRFGYQSFDIVTSLSVIEHGVEPDAYFAEMSRILKPGGLLITSTDYWYWKVSTKFVPRRKTFGLPWKIHDANDLIKIVEVSARWGFELTGDLSFEVEDPVVKWGGRKYTFISFAFRKCGE